jgi:tRNA-specific 2-thiouridylase
LYIVGAGTPGPAIVGYGDLNEEQIKMAANLFSRYSQGKGKKKIQILLNGNIVDIDEVDLEKLAEDIKKYLIL